MRKLPLLLAMLWLTFSYLPNLDAQIVNIEDRRGSLSDTTGWFGFAGFGANLVQNTKSIVSISGDIRVDYLFPKSRFLVLSNYNLIRANKERFIDNGFQHLRFNHYIRKKTEHEVFAQAQYNKQVRISFRGLLGTGLRFHVLEVDNGKIFWGIAYMFEYDEIEIVPETTSFFRDHRMSTYLSLSIKVNRNFSFANTTYYQPVLKQFSDVRLSSQTTLKLGITRKLSFTTTFNITNDTRVPENVPATYYTWRNGLRWEF